MRFSQAVYPGGVELEREGSEKEPLTVRVRAKSGSTTSELLSRLSPAG